MLPIVVPASERWDERRNEFISSKEQKLQLEHSLVSVAKWESNWGKPFLTNDKKSVEETIDYIRCMTLTQCVDPNVYYNLTEENMKEINKYIDSKMTATWFNEKKAQAGPRRKQVVTNELIYYWMIELGIPMECQKWHLSRLITLIRVCEEERKPKKKNKLSKRDLAIRNTALNEARLKALNTRG